MKLANKSHRIEMKTVINDRVNALFSAYKPINISSNAFLARIKRALKDSGCRVDRLGFSGILDPFACGCLTFGLNSYTKLLPHLDLGVKRYDATLFLGLKSASLDTENILGIHEIAPFELGLVRGVVEGMTGKIAYTPPSFSAKRINGVHAYTLARAGKSVALKESVMEVYSMEFIGYVHPYVSFRVSVSKGGYVRSLGEMIAKSLGVDGALCHLERLGEGGFHASYNSLTPFNPLECLGLGILGASELRRALGEDYKDIIYNGKDFTLDSEALGLLAGQEARRGENIFNGNMLKENRFNEDALKENGFNGNGLKENGLGKNAFNTGDLAEAGKKANEKVDKKVGKECEKRCILDLGNSFSLIGYKGDGRTSYLANNLQRHDARGLLKQASRLIRL